MGHHYESIIRYMEKKLVSNSVSSIISKGIKYLIFLVQDGQQSLILSILHSLVVNLQLRFILLNQVLLRFLPLSRRCITTSKRSHGSVVHISKSSTN